MSDKCVCHIAGYQIKDAYARQQLEKIGTPKVDYTVVNDEISRQILKSVPPAVDEVIKEHDFATNTDLENGLKEKQPLGAYLTQHQKIKTINGKSLIGSGDIQITASGTIEGDYVSNATYQEEKIPLVKGSNGGLQMGGCTSIGDRAIALGKGTKSDGYGSTALGLNTHARMAGAFAGGSSSEAGQTCSFTHGFGTKTARDFQVVFGQYNDMNSKALFQLGNGKSNDERSNVFEILEDASANLGGKKVATVDLIPDVTGYARSSYIESSFLKKADGVTLAKLHEYAQPRGDYALKGDIPQAIDKSDLVNIEIYNQQIAMLYERITELEAKVNGGLLPETDSVLDSGTLDEFILI